MARLPKVKLPDEAPRKGGKLVTIRLARRIMEELTEEAADIREDDSAASRHRRTEIARTLRAIQRQISDLEEVVAVRLKPTSTTFWPIRIGPARFMPGTHMVKKSVAQTLRYLVSQHKLVEKARLTAGGDAQGDALGRELPQLGQ